MALGLPISRLVDKRLLIAGGVVTFGFVLALAPLPVSVFPSLVVLFGGLFFGARWAMQRYRRSPLPQPARSVSEISSIDYFRRIPTLPLENWVRTALTSHGFLLLGDPVLGRSPVQGYAWLKGKKAVVVMRLERALKRQDLEGLYQLKNQCKAELAIIFSPFANAPISDYPGLEILAGQAFLTWMNVLTSAQPLPVGGLRLKKCGCGSPQIESVSRGGEPLLICSRYPDCKEVSCAGLTNSALAGA
jgi:hypothetical protein